MAEIKAALVSSAVSLRVSRIRRGQPVDPALHAMVLADNLRLRDLEEMMAERGIAVVGGARIIVGGTQIPGVAQRRFILGTEVARGASVLPTQVATPRSFVVPLHMAAGQQIAAFYRYRIKTERSSRTVETSRGSEPRGMSNPAAELR